MKHLKTLLLLVICACGSVSCTTSDYDPDVTAARPYVPRVTMPVSLNQEEQNLIGDVEQALEDGGLRPTDRAGAEYQLAFSVEDGPVNADVTLDLYQGRNRVAHAFARVGGPRILFKRQKVIREAFDQALREFEAQLPRSAFSPRVTGGYRQDSNTSPPPYRSGNTAPNPYGQPNPDYSY